MGGSLGGVEYGALYGDKKAEVDSAERDNIILKSSHLASQIGFPLSLTSSVAISSRFSLTIAAALDGFT